MSLHGQIRVQIDTEVSDRADGCDSISINAEWYGRDLVHATAGRAPHHFSLCGVQLQAIHLCVICLEMEYCVEWDVKP